ncbi:MAG: fibronectin type III domain-containing protein [bacterium]|nr:fibronectin type III domain-containing protein [bacterium]
MKKFLIVMLMASIVSPTFVFADNKSERDKEQESRKSTHMAEKSEKKENKEEDHKEKRENKEEQRIQKEMKRTVVRLEAAIARVQRLSDRVAERLTKYEARGVNTTASRAHLVEAKSKLALAQVKVQAIKLSIETSFATTTPATATSTTAKDTKRAFKTAVKSATETIKEAHQHVALAISSAKPGRNDGSHATTTPDTTAPVISLITKTGVASTTATVSWNTNELATGKLFYGTTTPLTAFVFNASSTLAHTFNLTGLTASTTYQLLLESKDAAGNTATTTSSLMTTI